MFASICAMCILLFFHGITSYRNEARTAIKRAKLQTKGHGTSTHNRKEDGAARKGAKSQPEGHSNSTQNRKESGHGVTT